MRGSIYAHRAKKALTNEELKRALQRFEGYEIRRLWLHNRGEPTMTKGFPEQLRIVREVFPQVPLYFSTNGTFIENDALRCAIVDCVTAMEVSIDGPDQSTAERYQVGVNFDRVVKNLKDLVDFRNRLPSAKPGIFWKYVLFHWNDRIPQLQAAAGLARRTGVDGMMLIPARTPIYAMPYHFLASRKKYVDTFKLSRTVLEEMVMSFADRIPYPYGGTPDQL